MTRPAFAERPAPPTVGLPRRLRIPRRACRATDLPRASDGVARAVRLDDAERAHLFDLARAAQPMAPPPRRRPAKHRIRPSLQQILDALTGAAGHNWYDRDLTDVVGKVNGGCRPGACRRCSSTSTLLVS